MSLTFSRLLRLRRRLFTIKGSEGVSRDQASVAGWLSHVPRDAALPTHKYQGYDMSEHVPLSYTGHLVVMQRRMVGGARRVGAWHSVWGRGTARGSMARRAPTVLVGA